MLDIIGIKTRQYEMILDLSDEEKRYAQMFARKHGINEDDLVVGLNTGAGKRWEKKRWSEETCEYLRVRECPSPLEVWPR
jgi:hypothetical protein